MKTNFLIIGSGIAGLNFALHAAEKGKVILITKKNAVDSNTNFAQGGIAGVLDKTDNVEKHIKDTLEAGDYHNNKRAVTFMIKKSTSAIHRLIDLGVQFEREKGELKLTREGGHHQRRIAYVGDYTGEAIEKILLQRVKENSNIQILENTFALRLITKNKICYGSQIIHKNKIEDIFADQTILATGGIGQLYKNTTNPLITTGDGIAMALSAGCKAKDMEFIQFHPSALDKNITPKFLISETVRGEGAKLLNSKGERFMNSRHPLKDLAPRSIVAREIYKELQKGPVYLDIRHKNKAFLMKRFPTIYKKLKEYGITMEKDLIPIIPAAHYLCGGIITNLQGETSIKNLYAFGEVAYTGVQGANRLASNSLLEALVFSNQIAKRIHLHKKTPTIKINKPKLISTSSKETLLAKSIKKNIKNIMWEYAGIVRDLSKIKKEAIPKMEKLMKELNKVIFTKGKLSKTNQVTMEASNMAIVGLLILKSASKRTSSLGCHYVGKERRI